MRTKTIQLLFLSLASIAFIASCSHSSGGFETDSKTGVVYRFIKHDENGLKASDSDYAKVVLAYSEPAKDGKDSVLFDSRKRGDSNGAVQIALQKTYNGSLEQGILMMSPGDSAEFQINADSLYLKFFHFPPDRLPPGVHGKTYTFHIKLVSFVTKNQMREQMNKQKEQYMKKMMERKIMEAPSIANYLKTNHYENVKPTSDSIFILERKGASGKPIKDGDSVEVKYTGMLLDGTVFDQSDKGPNQQTFKLVYSPNSRGLIKGWTKVLGTLHEGEKVKILLPSAMAYGPSGAGQIILPYSPLVFDIEVVSIKSNKKK